MPNGYFHVTRDQRSQIYGFLSINMSMRAIGRNLNLSASTISREIKRNTGQKGYRYEQADKLAKKNHSNSKRPKKLTPKIIDIIVEKLKLGWSPEQISGRLKKEGIINIHHTTIYRMISADRNNGGILYTFLRRKAKPYNRRGSKKAGRGCIPNRVDITERPEIVEKKLRIGDWEADTIIGANHKGAIVSVVDRASKYTILEKVEHKTSSEVSDVIIYRLSQLNQHIYTITFDNGKEFANHSIIAEKLNAKCFFAQPYHSWERGLNEHTNGLVREYVPKKVDFKKVSKEKIADIEQKLNHRPRKILEFKTPYEVFYNNR